MCSKFDCLLPLGNKRLRWITENPKFHSREAILTIDMLFLTRTKTAV